MDEPATIRDQLAHLIHRATCPFDAANCRPTFHTALDARRADAVLKWLGRLDPDADPELIAYHFRHSRERLAELAELARRLSYTPDAPDALIDEFGFPAVNIDAAELEALKLVEPVNYVRGFPVDGVRKLKNLNGDRYAP